MGSGKSLILDIYPIVLILSIVRIVIFNFNFINGKKVSGKSKIKILEDYNTATD